MRNFWEPEIVQLVCTIAFPLDTLLKIISSFASSNIVLDQNAPFVRTDFLILRMYFGLLCELWFPHLSETGKDDFFGRLRQP